MTKNTMKTAAVAAYILLFDDWADAIEDTVRAQVRGFIEAMLEEELADALARPRYGRRKPSGPDEPAPAVGCRHGHRNRTLTGTFGKTRFPFREPASWARTARRSNGKANRFAPICAAPRPPTP